MAEAPFVFKYRVTYADCTLGNHIYYARYLHLLELARGEFFRHFGQSFLQLQQDGMIFPVLECRVKYNAPARYDDLLSIQIRVPLADGIRLNFAYELHREPNTLIAQAETMHVCTGLDERPRRLPPQLLTVLQPWIVAPPAAPASPRVP